MTERIARFNELTPSTLPFVEGRIEGHKERKNYSIVGPGVAEDSHKQHPKYVETKTSQDPQEPRNPQWWSRKRGISGFRTSGYNNA